MQKVKVEVEVSKELYDVTHGLVSFVDDVMKALEDGYQMGDDFPEILTSAMNHLIPAVDGFSKVPGHVKDDKKGFIYACGLMGGDLYDVVTREPNEVPAPPPVPGLPSK